MKVTSISVQARNSDRVNVSIDGKYSFSLDVFQVGQLGLKVGMEIDQANLDSLLEESEFGKLYARALDYCLMRPHSEKEVRDYLWRKTRTKRYRKRKTGEIAERPGVSQNTAERVLERLIEKGHVDDSRFAKYWVDNRQLTKGISRRKLVSELRSKGVSVAQIDEALSGSQRIDEDELAKIIVKKRSKYPDDQKLIAYLARQGFDYDDIKAALDL